MPAISDGVLDLLLVRGKRYRTLSPFRGQKIGKWELPDNAQLVACSEKFGSAGTGMTNTCGASVHHSRIPGHSLVPVFRREVSAKYRLLQHQHEIGRCPSRSFHPVHPAT
jgi:hypothetical protein